MAAVMNGGIEWSFEKFLISRAGHVLKRYPPQTDPRDNGLLQDIADELEAVRT
jgi:glutathione peroxidase-family protein